MTDAWRRGDFSIRPIQRYYSKAAIPIHVNKLYKKLTAEYFENLIKEGKFDKE